MRHIQLAALAALVLAAACGDDGGTVDAAPQPIDGASIDSSTLIDATPIDAGPDADLTVDAAPADAMPLDAAPADAMPLDAAPADAMPLDAAPADAMPVDGGVALAPHLLITEVQTLGNSEFVEIYNPTAATIALDNYYLTDINNYWQLPGIAAGNVTFTISTSDFLERFPVGSSIAPGQVIVIAMDEPDFELAYTTASATYTTDELTDAVAMDTVLTVAAQNPGLTNSGEIVVLFYWDGVTDLVKDVDIVLAGNNPSATNDIAAKAAVDGPDVDTDTSSYAAEVQSIEDMATNATDTDAGSSIEHSYKRIAFEAGHETQDGLGNGITGDNEASEACRTTWDSQAVATTYTDGTPGTIPAALQ